MDGIQTDLQTAPRPKIMPGTVLHLKVSRVNQELPHDFLNAQLTHLMKKLFQTASEEYGDGNSSGRVVATLSSVDVTCDLSNHHKNTLLGYAKVLIHTQIFSKFFSKFLKILLFTTQFFALQSLLAQVLQDFHPPCRLATIQCG